MYDCYLLKDPKTRHAIEAYNTFLKRLFSVVSKSAELLDFISLFLLFMTCFSPQLITQTIYQQLSSCYLLTFTITLVLEAIYSKVHRHCTFIKICRWHKVVSWFSRQTVLSFLKTWIHLLLQLIKEAKKRVLPVVCQTWHADIQEFLISCVKIMGDDRCEPNLANLRPDLFMKHSWSLFDPSDAPEFGKSYTAKAE